MINSTFKLKMIKEGKESEIEVMLQEANKFRIADVYSESVTMGQKMQVGTFVENIVPLVVISPKNLLEQIGECDNAFTVMAEVSKEVQSFCDNPRLYKAKREEKERDTKETKSKGNK